MSRPDPDPADQPRTLAEARVQLQEAMAAVRADTAELQASRPTREQIEALNRAAELGKLGRDMQQIASQVAEGRDSWSAVFDGQSRNEALFDAYLEKVRPQLEQALDNGVASEEKGTKRGL